MPYPKKVTAYEPPFEVPTTLNLTTLLYETNKALDLPSVTQPEPEPPKPPPVVPKPVVAAPKPPAVATSKVTTSYNSCNCVSLVASKRPVVTGIGVAGNHPVNSKTPALGAIIITYESAGKKFTGHMGYVIGFTNTTVTFQETNYTHCKAGTRTLPLSSRIIKGFWL